MVSSSVSWGAYSVLAAHLVEIPDSCFLKGWILTLQPIPLQIFIPDSVLAHKTFLGTRRGSDKQGSLGQGKENVQISGV